MELKLVFNLCIYVCLHEIERKLTVAFISWKHYIVYYTCILSLLLFTEFVFLIDGVAFCNKRRHRKQSKVFRAFINYRHIGNPTKNSPEGFAAIVSLPSDEHKGRTIVVNGKTVKYYITYSYPYSISAYAHLINTVRHRYP